MPRTALYAFAMTVLLLPGCLDATGRGAGSAIVGGVDEETFQLEAGKGAIEGLLVDDRFRPIQLTEPGADGAPFQAAGFILLQETGQQLRTDENGLFAVVDLEPGRYTLRVTADGHEAIPATVIVDAGEFTEATVVARRTNDDNTAILSQEYVVFLDCALSLVLALPFDCSADVSGDSHRRHFLSDYRWFGDQVSALVMEMKAEQEKRYEINIWTEGGFPMYANDLFTGDYAHFVLRYNQTNTDNVALWDNDAWNNDKVLQTEIIVYGLLAEELGQVDEFFLGGGVGVHLAVKARFLHTVFIGEPDVDVDTFCVLC